MPRNIILKTFIENSQKKSRDNRFKNKKNINNLDRVHLHV